MHARKTFEFVDMAIFFGAFSGWQDRDGCEHRWIHRLCLMDSLGLIDSHKMDCYEQQEAQICDVQSKGT